MCLVPKNEKASDRWRWLRKIKLLVDELPLKLFQKFGKKLRIVTLTSEWVLEDVLFLKMTIHGFFFFIFSLLNAVDSKQSLSKSLPMTGFEPRTSCISGDRFANWATITALGKMLFLSYLYWPLALFDPLMDNLNILVMPRYVGTWLLPPSTPDFLGDVVLIFALGLVTSCCGCLAAWWRPSFWCMGWESMCIGDPS